MRKSMTRVGFAVAMMTAGVAGPVLAANDTCTNAFFVNMGGSKGDTATTTNVDNWFRVFVRAGHSYAFEAWAPFTDASVQSAELNMDGMASDCTTAIAFSGSYTDQEVSGHNGDGNTFIATTTGPINIRVFNNVTPAVNYSFVFRAIETTLLSPFWQVATAAGYDAAPQILNSYQSTRNVTITMFSNTGATVCSNTVTIPGSGMTTFGISGPAPGCATSSAFGWARIAHNGPPGSIQGNITTFSGTAGLSFDSPFFERQSNVSANMSAFQ